MDLLITRGGMKICEVYNRRRTTTTSDGLRENVNNGREERRAVESFSPFPFDFDQLLSTSPTILSNFLFLSSISAIFPLPNIPQIPASANLKYSSSFSVVPFSSPLFVDTVELG